MRLQILALVSALPATLAAQDYTAPRNATVPASNARRIEIIGRAGVLRVDGRAGARDVVVRGTARASTRRGLEEVQLIAEERDGTIHIEADIPENRDWNDDDHQSLDLTIEVPRDLPLEVADGSGDLQIRNVGPLTVTDGSGELAIRDVQGGVEIGGKGSGTLRLTNIDRSVHVRSKGSGSIDASHIGGDFVVDRKASGGIEYSDVKGRVEVPEQRRRWRSE
jgi:hypothetical protein